MVRVPVFSCALVLAIVACGGNKPVAKDANATAGLPDINAVAPTSTGEPHVKTAPAEPSPAPAAQIPAALRGRWGLTPADCTSTRGDAKGLLIVTPDELRFYESRAVPADGVAADANSISGNFDFTGEGQSWTKYEALKLDKRMLVRTEVKPTASFSYAKCS
jgi:hypothetical protein